MIDLRTSAEADRGLRRRSLRLAVTALLDLGMPAAEIGELLQVNDPRIVHRHLALHLERLEERFVEQRTTLVGIEAILSGR